MRVLFDTTYAERAPRSGTGIYVRRVCDELARREGVELLEVANPRRRQPAGGGLGSARNLASDLWWTNVELPRRARRVGAELIHHPLPARARPASVPQVVTVVDLAFERLPACFDRTFRIYAHQTHRAAALAAGAVICISETTARDARELWDVRPERIVVAPLGAGQELTALPRPSSPTHFLYVGDDEPRKDLPTLLAAYRSYRGGTDEPLALILAGSASARGPGIVVERHPTPERLAELYAGAAALVHSSRYEGFGLTAAEAMRLGVPVLAARVPGISEVCGDAARYVDPGDASGFATAMAELERNEILREELRRRGQEQAARFSWSACASAHLDAYSLALEHG